MTLIVCPLSRLDEMIALKAPSHLISLLSPAEMIEEHRLLKGRHLRVGVHDIVEPLEGHTPPRAEMVEDLLSFAAGWTGERPLLVHCWAGISRSSASAYILACARNPHVPESEIAEALRTASKIAQPNARLVALADERLGRNGRMTAAVAGMAPAVLAYENEPFELKSVF